MTKIVRMIRMAVRMMTIVRMVRMIRMAVRMGKQ